MFEAGATREPYVVPFYLRRRATYPINTALHIPLPLPSPSAFTPDNCHSST
jgi:hypothetical protein